MVGRFASFARIIPNGILALFIDGEVAAMATTRLRPWESVYLEYRSKSPAHALSANLFSERIQEGFSSICDFWPVKLAPGVALVLGCNPLSELNEEPFDPCSSAAFAADVAAAEGSADAGAAADVDAAAAADDGAALVCCADTAGVTTNGIANAVHNATHDARFLIKIPFRGKTPECQSEVNQSKTLPNH